MPRLGKHEALILEKEVLSEQREAAQAALIHLHLQKKKKRGGAFQPCRAKWGGREEN